MQILTVFDQFINWPEYDSCAFNAMLEKHLEKLYSNPDENTRGIDSDEEDDDELESHEEFDPKQTQ